MTSPKRTRNMYDPQSPKPFKLSRTKLENFIKCPRCFYLDRRLGIGRPGMPAFTLNIAVDHLLKKEFDVYRAKGAPHPLMKENGVDAVPFRHKDLDIWRQNFKGVQYFHKPTNFLIHGAVDDIWQTPAGELIVVDYKATSTADAVTLDGKWKEAYKRQMEIYQWLFRQNGFRVQEIGYFVSVNARKDRPTFDGHLHFDIHLLAHRGDDAWVESVVMDAKKCLMSDTLPAAADECEFCSYRKNTRDIEN